MLLDDRRSGLSARRHFARIRWRKTVSPHFASESTDCLDRFIHCLGSVPVAVANLSSARLEGRIQYSGPGGLGRLFPGKGVTAQFHGQSWFFRPAHRHLPSEPDPHDRFATDSPYPADHFRHKHRACQNARVAAASAAAQNRPEGPIRNQPERAGQTAPRHRKAT